MLYFTGEAIEDDDDDYDEEGEEADEVIFTKWTDNSLYNTLRSKIEWLVYSFAYNHSVIWDKFWKLWF